MKLTPTIGLLNEVLKSSFGVVVDRSKNGRGRAMCERGLLELCAWGLDGNTFHHEINNDARTTFPFNVVDMVDDLDPTLGKMRNPRPPRSGVV